MSPYVPLIVLSLRVTVNSNSLLASAARSLTTVLDTSRSPVSLVFVNSADPASSAVIVPSSPVFSVSKSSSAFSSTVYVTVVGRPFAVLLSPPFSVNVATPSVNVMSPYVPLILVSLRVTVNSNSLLASAARSLTTVLDTSRSPVSLVFVTVVVAASSLIVPDSPSYSASRPSTSTSSTVYSTSVGSPSAVALSPPFSVNFATPFVNVMSPYVPLIVLSLRVTVNSKSFVLSAARSLSRTFFTVSPLVTLVFVNSAVDFSVLIFPAASVLSGVSPSTAVSVTVYSTSVGRPVTCAFSPPASSTVATPSVNVTSPYSPLIVLSLSVIVNVNFCVLSIARSLTTFLLTSRSPTSLVFVTVAVEAVALILPVSPSYVIMKPSASSSETV